MENNKIFAEYICLVKEHWPNIRDCQLFVSIENVRTYDQAIQAANDLIDQTNKKGMVHWDFVALYAKCGGMVQ